MSFRRCICGTVINNRTWHRFTCPDCSSMDMRSPLDENSESWELLYEKQKYKALSDSAVATIQQLQDELREKDEVLGKVDGINWESIDSRNAIVIEVGQVLEKYKDKNTEP